MDITQHLDRLKESFLWAAAKGGRSSEVASLLTMGADVNWVQHDGQSGGVGDTPLLSACRNGHEETVLLLLASGADATAKTAEGDTAMHLAARRGDLNLCNTLSETKVELSELNAQQETAIDVAITKGYGALSQRLMDILTKGDDSDVDSPRATPRADVSLPSINANSASQQLRQTIDENRRRESMRARQQRLLLGEGAEVKSHEQLQQEIADEAGSESEWESVSGSEEEEEESDESDGRAAAQKDNVISHAMSHEAWHRSMVKEAGIVPSAGKDKKEDKEGLQKQLQEYQEKLEKKAIGNEEIQLISSINVMPLSEQVAHLNKALDAAALDKQKFQNQANAIKEQTGLITSDLMAAETTSNRLRKERDKLRMRVKELLGLELKDKNMAQLEAIESELKQGLLKVGKEKEKLVSNMLNEEEEKRLCVVCQTSTKSVLLMPCRHMCLCAECSRNNAMTKCPLCRKAIEQKVDVYT